MRWSSPPGRRPARADPKPSIERAGRADDSGQRGANDSAGGGHACSLAMTEASATRVCIREVDVVVRHMTYGIIIRTAYMLPDDVILDTSARAPVPAGDLHPVVVMQRKQYVTAGTVQPRAAVNDGCVAVVS